MADAPAPIFTGAFKARNRVIASIAIILASAAPFAIGLVVITFFLSDFTSWVAGLVTAVAFLASGGFTWVVQNRFALMGNEWLRAELWSRLVAREALPAERDRAEFVGFAPGDEILTWEGETDLDVGFLCMLEDGLAFVGDKFSWSLAKERIDRIDLTPTPSGPTRRIVVRWHAPREAGRSFTLESREATSLRESDTQTIGLFKRIRQWSLKEPEHNGQRLAMGYPPTDQQSGRPIDEPAAGWCATTLAMMSIVVLTIWYFAKEMLADGFIYHAALWAGFIFVGGTVFTRCLLHYLQSATSPVGARRSSGHA